ncbi:YSIRK-type signal peptide-containing protein (plasmid) [Staphylococcus warneri]|nr:YSIRK-type signal peptide-containing protein [Staphylococcus warneri]
MKKSKKRLDFLPNKLNKYSIRRFSVGTASILVGATLLFGINNGAHAAEQNETQSVSQEATNDDSTSEAPQETPAKEEATNDDSTSEAPQETPAKEEATNDDSTSEAPQEAPAKEKATNDDSTSEAPQETPAKEETTNDDSTSEAPQETPAKEEATNDDSASEAPQETPAKEEATNDDSTSEAPQEAPAKEKATNDDSTSEAPQETPAKEETTNDDSTSEAPQETPAKEEATNDDSASEAPDYVGVNSDSLENSTLENGDDESSNDQDKDIAYATPAEATAPRSIEPRSRVALNETQAQKQGKNVNDLITVTNQSITEGGREDGIISAHDGENITYTTDFKIDNDVKSGDTMTVKYDPRTVPSDLTDDHTPVDIMDPSGEVIATGSFDNTNKTSTYTFTDYVDKYENVNAKLVMNSFIDKKEVPNEETVDLTFATANEPINKTFNVSYQRPIVERASNIQSIFSQLDLDDNTVEQTVYVNPLSLNAQNAKVLIRGAGVYNDGGFFNGEGSTIIDNSTDIKVYKAKPDQKLPQSNRIYDYSQYEDVTNQVNIDKNYSNNQAMVDFGNINSPYIIKVKSKYTPGAEDSLAIQQGVRMTTTNDGILSYAGYTNSIISTNDQGGGNGEEAPEQTYKIGDYVWEDVDKDGVQGTDEKENQSVTY